MKSTAVGVELARVAHSIVKNNVDYYGYPEVFRRTQISRAVKVH